MSSQVKIVIFICVAVILSLFFYRASKKHNDANVGGVKLTMNEDENLEVGADPRDRHHDHRHKTRDIENLQYPEIKRSRVGLQTIPYKMNAKQVRMLAVDVVPESVCHRGDLEAIKALVGGDGSMLLTIEPLSESLGASPNGSDSAKIISKKLTVSSLERGISTDLEIRGAADGAYGIYLCSDHKGSGSCSSKSVANYNELLSQTTLTNDQDAVFFFQMIVLEKPDAQLFNGSVRDLPEVRQELMRQGLNDGQLRKALKRTASLMSAVQSLPPGVSADGSSRKIVLPIARLDRPETCRP